ncbi:MAG TPA: peptide-methionine (R)-S-oxide reductase MsrB [Pirellulaceae bacterium]
MKRRVAIWVVAAVMGAVFLTVRFHRAVRAEPAVEPAQEAGSEVTSTPAKEPGMVKVKVINAAGELIGPVEMPRVVKTDAEWQAQLGADTYKIARNKGTEAPFCGNLIDNHQEGVYSCVCCGLPLFASGAKFESGTGWPSFFQPIAPENIIEHADNSLGIQRTEILCARCDCHLGHVFEDGPRPTGLRFCLNSASLKFTNQKSLWELAEPAAPAEK